MEGVGGSSGRGVVDLVDDDDVADGLPQLGQGSVPVIFQALADGLLDEFNFPSVFLVSQIGKAESNQRKS